MAPTACEQRLPELIAEYQTRCEREGASSAIARARLRQQVLREAGYLDYDFILGEFQKLKDHLRWPPAATLKDLRHFFATLLNNGGVPDAYRHYLMGHAPGKAAILTYTHLDQLARHYSAALQTEGGLFFWRSSIGPLAHP